MNGLEFLHRRGGTGIELYYASYGGGVPLASAGWHWCL